MDEIFSALGWQLLIDVGLNNIKESHPYDMTNGLGYARKYVNNAEYEPPTRAEMRDLFFCTIWYATLFHSQFNSEEGLKSLLESQNAAFKLRQLRGSTTPTDLTNETNETNDQPGGVPPTKKAAPGRA